MLAEQIHDAISAARTGARLDELARQLSRVIEERHVPDDEAHALFEAIAARRAVLKGERPPPQEKAAGARA